MTAGEPTHPDLTDAQRRAIVNIVRTTHPEAWSATLNVSITGSFHGAEHIMILADYPLTIAGDPEPDAAERVEMKIFRDGEYVHLGWIDKPVADHLRAAADQQAESVRDLLGERP